GNQCGRLRTGHFYSIRYWHSPEIKPECVFWAGLTHGAYRNPVLRASTPQYRSDHSHSLRDGRCFGAARQPDFKPAPTARTQRLPSKILLLFALGPRSPTTAGEGFGRVTARFASRPNEGRSGSFSPVLPCI